MPLWYNMSVISCKVYHLRPGYHTIIEWLQHPDHVYIGRKGIVFIKGERFPIYDSIWTTPYKIGRDGTRAEVVQKYETLMRAKLAVDKELRQALMQLEGKVLGCWCAPEPCHGHVLLKLIEEQRKTAL